MPAKITQAEIRKAATSEKVITRLKEMENILDKSMIDILMGDIKKLAAEKAKEFNSIASGKKF
jgi:cobalamin biosynthesis Co2+ chelatase CbiK